MEATAINNISINEYLSISQEQDQKYEYHDGSIFAMAGGTINHSRISTNFITRLGSELLSKNSEYEHFNSDARLRIEVGNRLVYPDDMVVCGEIERAEAEKESITNPTVIVEVLSDTTEGYDRGDKFYFYRQVQSLKEYILIAQDKQQVDVFVKADGEFWNIKRFDANDEVLKIESIDIEIPLDAIYRNVVFEV